MNLLGAAQGVLFLIICGPIVQGFVINVNSWASNALLAVIRPNLLKPVSRSRNDVRLFNDLVANFVGIFVTPFGNALIKGNLSGELKLFPLLEVGHNSKGKKSGWLRLHISLYRYLHIPPLPFRLLHLLLQRKLLTSTSPWLLSPSTLSRSYLMA
jgi:hypothetical protein